MVIYENECCRCATGGYPCRGSECSLRKVPHCYCDKCKNEFRADELYIFGGKDVCVECLIEEFKTVKEREGL